MFLFMAVFLCEKLGAGFRYLSDTLKLTNNIKLQHGDKIADPALYMSGHLLNNVANHLSDK